jgi:hypothetical protein
MSIQQIILQNLLTAVLASVDEKTVRRIADFVLDAVEDLVQNSDNPVDDMVLLPLAKTARLALNIPDNDQEGNGGGLS